MNEDLRKLDDAQRRAEAAKALLENPILRLSLESIKAEALREFEESKPEETAERDQSYHLLRALRRLEAKLAALVVDGEATKWNMRSRLR